MPRVKQAPPRPAAAAARPARWNDVQDRPGKWQVLIRRQRRLLVPAAIGLAALVVIGVGTLALRLSGPAVGGGLGERLGASTGLLGLRLAHVEIKGSVKTPEPLLRAAIGMVPGMPILAYSVQAARTRIEQIPWVRAATVERRLPDTLIVQIEERRPFAVWQHEGRFRLIDHDGNVVTDSDVADFAGQLPLVVGVGAPSEAAALLDLLAQHPDIQRRLTAAVRVGERRWNLRLNNGTDVLLPEGAERQALSRLDELQTEHALLDRPLQAIDLRLPDRLVFRPQAAPKETAPNPSRRPT